MRRHNLFFRAPIRVGSYTFRSESFGVVLISKIFKAFRPGEITQEVDIVEKKRSRGEEEEPAMGTEKLPAGRLRVKPKGCGILKTK